MLGFIISNQISAAQRTRASRAEIRNIAEDQLRDVYERLDSLELACAGLWDLLKFKHGYTDDELIHAIRTVDARDGVQDGKLTRPAIPCTSCQRTPLVRNPKKCSWCGAPITPKAF